MNANPAGGFALAFRIYPVSVESSPYRKPPSIRRADRLPPPPAADPMSRGPPARRDAKPGISRGVRHSPVENGEIIIPL